MTWNDVLVAVGGLTLYVMLGLALIVIVVKVVDRLLDE
jgi:heme exporter protein D